MSRDPKPTARCPRCGGTGCEKGAAIIAFNSKNPKADLVKCRQCDGKGTVLAKPK